ncbi:hypothetical protein [Streptomyces puniciscabiei]|uniref:hypothetical protein n=1 Tax=Streptomyces puniciscabiei TaxID=164348 RepID=UPI00331C38C8
MTVRAVAVALGAGLTLGLREDARPRGPYVWDDGHGAGPSPGARRPQPQPPGERGGDRSCPPSPPADPGEASPPNGVIYLYATAGSLTGDRRAAR